MTHSQCHDKDTSQQTAQAEDYKKDGCSKGQLAWAKANRIQVLTNSILHPSMIGVDRRLIQVLALHLDVRNKPLRA